MSLRHRVGLGTDRHRLEAGRPLILGGVTIPSDVGPVGYSDSDVVFHSLADALLGAVCAGDIGELFPDTDPKWAGMDSAVIVGRAMECVRDAGYQLGNCDIAIQLERPKLLPHRRAMRESIAEALDVSVDQVFVKAKSGEAVGVVGRGEAIEASAIVLLVHGTS